jgi:hypothetical protein
MIQVITLFNLFVNNLAKINYFKIFNALNTRSTSHITYKHEVLSSGTVKFKTNSPFGTQVKNRMQENVDEAQCSIILLFCERHLTNLNTLKSYLTSARLQIQITTSAATHV